MKKLYTAPVRSAPASSRKNWRREFIAFIVTFALLGTLVWLGSRPAPQVAPYQASALELTLSGALMTSLSLSALGELADASITPAGFRFVTEGEAIDFALEFSGAAAGTYDLSSGAYPLTLRLLENGESYHTFTAQSGTVTLNETGGTVSASLTDETGQHLFVNARFTDREARACSESYYFCFNAAGV